MSRSADDLLRETLAAADEAMIKLEMVDGMPVWEAMPGPKHQRLVVAIANSVSRTADRAVVAPACGLGEPGFRRYCT